MSFRVLHRGGVALVLLALASFAAHAGAPRNVRPEERALLPRYCNYVQGYVAGPQAIAEYDRLVKVYGGGWTHMHHYCYALIEIARLDKRSIARPAGYASPGGALDNIDYVLRNTEPGFTPRAEILARKARLQARYISVSDAFETADLLVQEWPQYPDGYVIQAELLLKAGERDKAMKVLDVGAQTVADKDRFDKLKGLLNLN